MRKYSWSEKMVWRKYDFQKYFKIKIQLISRKGIHKFDGSDSTLCMEVVASNNVSRLEVHWANCTLIYNNDKNITSKLFQKGRTLTVNNLLALHQI